VEDRLRALVPRPQRVRDLLSLGVEEDGAVRPRGLGNRIALHRRRPGAAVRVVLERVEVARPGPTLERDLGDLAGGAGMVRRELAALLCLAKAPAAGREDDRPRLDDVLAASCAPARLDPLERAEGRLC